VHVSRYRPHRNRDNAPTRFELQLKRTIRFGIQSRKWRDRSELVCGRKFPCRHPPGPVEVVRPDLQCGLRCVSPGAGRGKADGRLSIKAGWARPFGAISTNGRAGQGKLPTRCRHKSVTATNTQKLLTFQGLARDCISWIGADGSDVVGSDHICRPAGRLCWDTRSTLRAIGRRLRDVGGNEITNHNSDGRPTSWRYTLRYTLRSSC
jgi:hypothetical protein